jgi:hypothetical protein
MRKVLFLSLMFVFIFLTAGIGDVNAVSCSDSDGGVNYYEKGSATKYEGDEDFTTDVCESDSLLREYYCKETSSSVSSRVHECPEGCSEGKCLGEPIPVGEFECFDSDEGINLYEKGHLIDKKNNEDSYDSCLDENTLREYYCDPDSYLFYSFDCPNGCVDGACSGLLTEQTSSSCEISDFGVNFYEKGIATAVGGLNSGTFEERCEGDSVIEYTCDIKGALEIKFDCLYGCNDGKCKTQELIEPKGQDTPIVIPDNTKETTYLCNGCELEGKCYAFGYRKSDKYCSDASNEFVIQETANSECENNFECTSNICLSGQCVDESLLRKIINWFKKLF